jgi:hypothetical protein
LYFSVILYINSEQLIGKYYNHINKEYETIPIQNPK